MTALVPVPNAAQARVLTDRIKIAVEGAWHLIVEAYESRAWQALGYSSWDDYCTREFGTSRLRLPREERAEQVQSLREAGLSLRAIGAVTGYATDTIRRELSGVRNRTPAQPIVRTTGQDVDDRGTADADDYGAATESEFETALTVSREQDDLSRDNVVANLPQPKVTGIDGKSYSSRSASSPRRKPLVEVAKDRGFAIRAAVDQMQRVFDDDRYRTNEKQVADALRGHLLYVAETVAAVLDQLP